jgi:hypothetical protein
MLLSHRDKESGRLFSNVSVFKKEILWYDKPVMTCFKSQVNLHGSEAISYLNSIL